VRWLHLSVVTLFAAVIVLFVAQNHQIVTMSFLGFRATLPMALLAGIIYLLGMVTGGSLIALLRRSVAGARRRTTTTP